MARASKGRGEEFEIRLLGPVQAVHRGRVLDLGGVQVRSVLAVLMLHPGQVVPRGAVIRNAWRGDPPTTASQLVTAYVSRLRSALAPAAAVVRLDAVRPGFRAGIDPNLIDAHRFAALLRQAGQDKAASEDELAIAHLQQALALWRGRSVGLEDVEAEWLRSQANALQDQRFDAMEQLAALYRRADRPSQAVRLLRAEAPRYPQRDSMIAALVEALTESGQGAAAVEVADRACDRLDQAGLPAGPLLREARRRAQRIQLTAAAGPPRQLPPDTSAFTGREREVAELVRLAEAAGAAAADAAVISAIDGMAGIGKTALAVHVGHRLAERFPDGQLFVDLHGFTRGLAPRTATDVLADLLRTLGVTSRQIPDDLGARAGLFRDQLADKRMLLVLDAAANEEQVRPLLPAHPGCLVLVTSRRRLKGLDEALVLSLDVLPMPDAVALLRTVAGPGRIPPGDPLLEQIAHLCGRLPLALRIAAALLRHRPSWTLAHLAERLHVARGALDGFGDGDRDLGGVFDLSYNALPEDQQVLFQRLGLHPGPDIDAYAAAALLDSDPNCADALLQQLVDQNLVAESPPGRYHMHDLLRGYARRLAKMQTAAEREATVDRLLVYYAHTAHRASIPIARYPRTMPNEPAPRYAPALADPHVARTWLRSEYHNLDAAHAHARAHELDCHALALASGLAEVLRTDGPWPRALELHRDAATMAEARGQADTQAAALTELARVQYLSGRYAEAGEAQNQALEIFARIGDRLGEASAMTDLGRVRRASGDLAAAGDALARALEIFREIGNRLGRATALTELARVRRLTGDYRGAENAHTQALDIYREIGSRNGEAWALNHYAATVAAAGDIERALALYRDALRMNRDLDKPDDEALSLEGAAECLLETGHTDAGISHLRQALGIFQRLGMHLATKRVRARLADTGFTAPDQSSGADPVDARAD